jgi:hypothetical protein
MAERIIHQLPDDYHETRYFLATEKKTLIWLNILSLVPLLIALGGMVLWMQQVRRWRGNYPNAFGESIPWFIAVLVIFVVMMLVHEALHGVAIRLLGHKPRFGIKWDKGVAYATADNALFWKWQFIFIALTPLVAITLGGMALMALLPDPFAYYTGLLVVCNAGGAIGDLWMSVIVWPYPADTLVRDEEDGIRVYRPINS